MQKYLQGFREFVEDSDNTFSVGDDPTNNGLFHGTGKYTPPSDCDYTLNLCRRRKPLNFCKKQKKK